MSSRDLVKALGDIVGLYYVSDETVDLWTYSGDCSIAKGKLPSVVVRPKDAVEISRIMKLANRTKTPVTPRGGGAGIYGGAIPQKGGILLDLTRLNKVLEVDEEAMTCTVEAGMTFSKLETELAKRNLTYGITPESGASATIGGHLSLNGTGIGSEIYGAQPDQVVGLKVVLPNGEVVETGSASFNNVGHLFRYTAGSDLTGLFLGSEGTLGVIVETSLRVYPLPEEKRFFTYGLNDSKKAIEAIRSMRDAHIRNDLPTLYMCRFFESFEELPETTFPTLFLLYVMLSGGRDHVEEDEERLTKILPDGCEDFGPEFAEYYWTNKFTLGFKVFHDQGYTWQACPAIMPFSRFPKIMEEAKEIGKKQGVPVLATGSYTCANAFHGILLALYRGRETDARNRVCQAVDEIAKIMVENGASLMRLGTIFTKHAIPMLGTYYDLLKTIKKALDPNNIMNPGVIFG